MSSEFIDGYNFFQKTAGAVVSSFEGGSFGTERAIYVGSVEDEISKLEESINQFFGDNTPIIPIYTYFNRRTFIACKMLFERGVYVNSTVSPAVPVGSSLIRTSYMATHNEEQMDRAAKEIKAVLDLVKDIND